MKCIYYNDPYVSRFHDSKISPWPLHNYPPFIFTVSGVTVLTMILLALRRMFSFTSTHVTVYGLPERSMWSTFFPAPLTLPARSFNFVYPMPLSRFSTTTILLQISLVPTHILTIKKGSQIILFSSAFFQWNRKDKRSTELSLLKGHSKLITYIRGRFIRFMFIVFFTVANKHFKLTKTLVYFSL